jgi:hypothetical protein
MAPPEDPPEESPSANSPPRRKWTEEEIADAEAEKEYWDRAGEDLDRERRSAAIEEMEDWFRENFEDPQNETPYDSETGEYQYIWGGPFDASDMIESQFGDQYEPKWIEAAVENVTSDGTYDWAPTSAGEFYEPPEDEGADTEDESAPEAGDGRPEISAKILSKLDALEAALAELTPAPPNIGHNLPPDEVGLPPYDEQSRRDLEDAARQTRDEVASDAPNTQRLNATQSTFRKIGAAILKWIGKKLDLAVDEAIKATVKAAAWGTVAAYALGIADDIAALIRTLMGR